MKRLIVPALLTLSIAFLAVSCRDVFTTSMGSSLARDKISVSSSTSTGDLVDIAKGDYSADSGVASEVLAALSGKDQASLLALSADDKAAILNLAPSAAADMGTLTDLAKRAQESGSDTDALIEDAYNAFDPSVNLTAIETLLADDATLQTAPVDSLILASSVVLADVSSELGPGGSETVMDIMADPASLATSSLSDEQKARVQTIIDATTIIEARPGAGDVNIGDFKVIDFLRGTQP